MESKQKIDEIIYATPGRKENYQDKPKSLMNWFPQACQAPCFLDSQHIRCHEWSLRKVPIRSQDIHWVCFGFILQKNTPKLRSLETATFLLSFQFCGLTWAPLDVFLFYVVSLVDNVGAFLNWTSQWRTHVAGWLWLLAGSWAGAEHWVSGSPPHPLGFFQHSNCVPRRSGSCQAS